MLTLPVTIRPAQAKDMPYRENINELLEKREAANITQGFIIKPNKTHQLPFAFYAEININNDRLWSLFLALASGMPGEAHCVYGLNGEEAKTTGLFPLPMVLNKLSAFEKELTMDCSLEFGLLHHDKDGLMEIFIPESKYIRFWGSDKETFLQHMKSFGLQEVAGLAFIDEYPKVVMPLRDFLPAARRAEDVVYVLDRAFNI